jgi:hypothetical protein
MTGKENTLSEDMYRSSLCTEVIVARTCGFVLHICWRLDACAQILDSRSAVRPAWQDCWRNYAGKVLGISLRDSICTALRHRAVPVLVACTISNAFRRLLIGEEGMPPIPSKGLSVSPATIPATTAQPRTNRYRQFLRSFLHTIC